MSNRIVTENEITDGRAPQSYWDVPHSNAIEGFATDISVNAGSRVDFKINVNDGAGTDYKVEIFRLGYYGGDGAREVYEWTNSNAVNQDLPLYDQDRGLVDAGNWTVTDSWVVPADAVSGVYLARLQRLDANGDPIPGEANQIPFIVRNDGLEADIVLQTSDTTWHAYNGWHGGLGNANPSGPTSTVTTPGSSTTTRSRIRAVLLRTAPMRSATIGLSSLAASRGSKAGRLRAHRTTFLAPTTPRSTGWSKTATTSPILPASTPTGSGPIISRTTTPSSRSDMTSTGPASSAGTSRKRATRA